MHEHREARFALRGLQKAATQTLPSAVHTVRIVYELQELEKWVLNYSNYTVITIQL